MSSVPAPAPPCSFCPADSTTTDGVERACTRCAPLLDQSIRCACGDDMPVRMVGFRPTCMGCLEAQRLAAQRSCLNCHGSGITRGFGGGRCPCVRDCEGGCGKPIPRADYLSVGDDDERPMRVEELDVCAACAAKIAAGDDVADEADAASMADTERAPRLACEICLDGDVVAEIDGKGACARCWDALREALPDADSMPPPSAPDAHPLDLALLEMVLS